ncbi:thiol reductant ABC exporter subunit CydC [Sanguibacter suaedae]|uniref:Thiol reductant ABC exporter subunit CydC n=1 Tax=Sanguibacter suaedae TaxID=2795737 RepID=A0A934MD37_9MICO|nr:thiol reductant ABC exporter subunit CydC [Sanguibacter suaedae]MBI9114449.1 thiol reductant ABC exporter subunit CydC [Sanguibacter suaedae]
MRRDPLWRAVAMLGVEWRKVALAVALGVLALGSAVALAAVSAWLVARASQMPPVLTLSVATVGVRTFGISRGVFRYLERLASHTVALHGMATLRTEIYSRLAVGRPESVAALRRGDLLARVGADVDAVGDVVVRGLLPAAVALVVSAGSVGLLAAFHGGAAVVLAACLVLAGVLAPWLAAVGARTTESRTSEARAEMAAVSLEIVEHSALLTVSGRLTERLDALRAADSRLTRATDRGARTSGLAAGLGTLAVGLAVLGALVVAVPAVGAGTLDPVELAVVVLTPLAVFEATLVLPGAAIQVQRSRRAARRILALLDDAAPRTGHPLTGQPEAPSRTAHDGLPGGTDGDTDGVLVDARGLACGWPGRRPVLTGLDLTLTPGRSVALVGASGTGKTTTLLTLAGLLPPVGGTLRPDGTAVHDATDAARTAVVTTEDAHVFDTTVLENLRVARGDVTDDEARDALRRAGLGAWLDALPDGLLTQLGSDATTISGGERRRLLAARALCSDAPVLLLDEPTEHLDPQTADTLLRDLLRLGDDPERPRAVVVATHRTAPLVAADEVLVLAHGEVAARGTHDSLLVTHAAYREGIAAEDGGPTAPEETQ